jgi:ACR3 family arsenite transporter
LGQFLPGVFQSISQIEIAQVNLPVGFLIWVMIIPMLVKVDFSTLGELRRHSRGSGVTLFVNWLAKPFSMALFRMAVQPSFICRPVTARAAR